MWLTGWMMAQSLGAADCQDGDCNSSAVSNAANRSSASISSVNSVIPEVTTPSVEGGEPAENAVAGEPQGKVRKPAVRKPVPHEAPTEFQMLVSDSAGRMLPIFGSSLFLQPPSTFAPVEDAPAPAGYVIGPGDQLAISVWGSVSLHLKATVDRNGTIFIPKVGDIPVAGVRYDQLDERLHAAVGRIFKNFELSATLAKLRSIDIFFVGQARQPGSYTVSSLSTLVNAVFAAGGPSAQGSMRHIQLKRDGKLVVDFDLYDLLLHGDKSKDAPLLAGDVIYIPPVGPQVAMSGSVNAPAIYELRDAQSTLADVVNLAGGLNSVADGGRVTIERIDRRHSRSIDEISLNEQGQRQAVKDGDIVRVFAIVPRFDNAITLRGNVANPGRYLWRPGMRVRDLIPNKESLLTRGYWRTQNCMVDGRATQYAAVKHPAKSNATQALEPLGGCQAAEVQELSIADKNTKVDAETLFKESATAEPEINWEYASIQRLDPVNFSTVIVPFALGKAILEKDEANNLELKAGDVVTIFSQRDLAVAQDRKTKLVRIEGEVPHPGIYRVENGETLRSLLNRVGGLTPNAYPFASFFTRESARVEQQQSIARIADELEAEIQQKSVANSNSSADSANADAMAAMAQSQLALVKSMRATLATGRVVLTLKPTAMAVTDYPELVLEDGDRLLIPARGATVSVVGSVFNQSSYLYHEGKTVGAYIHEAGNGTVVADTKHALLVRADGSVLGRKSAGLFWGSDFNNIRVLPGDTIVIPAKINVGGTSRAMREWLQILSQGAIAAAVVVK
jgi:protein involved in polysaccharide export with SLBB domain